MMCGPSRMIVLIYLVVLLREVSSAESEQLVSGVSPVDESNIYCEKRGLCSHILLDRLNFTDQNCHCDEQCLQYRDCCPDFQPADTHLGALPIESLSCEPRKRPHGIISGLKAGERVYMLTRCPLAFGDEEVRNLCEHLSKNDPFLSVPVTDTKTGVLFGNYFCALCHGIDTAEFWKIAVRCYKNREDSESLTIDIIHEMLNSSGHGCQRFYEPPNQNITVRKCKHTKVGCPQDWSGSEAVKQLCSNHTSYVYHSYKVYRNVFCALCHGVEETDLTCLPPVSSGFSVQGRNIFKRPPSFSLIMDLNSGLVGIDKRSVLVEEKTVMSQCPDGSIYDPFLGQCRSLVCPPGQRFAENGTVCVPVILRIKDVNRVRISDSSMKKSVGMNELNLPASSLPNYTECARIAYNSSDYVLWDNGTVLVQDQVYLREAYTIDKDILYVCPPESMDRNYTMKMNVTSEEIVLNYDNIESILTVVGLTISLFCLALNIIIHVIFPVLRNTSGKCIIGLSLSLFVGQLLFLFATKVDNYGACYVFAVILHYAFLASFCWTNCLSFDIWRAFSTSYGLTGRSSSRFREYCLYACGCPAAVVLLSMVLDFSPRVSDSYQPHYGERYCLINRSGALLVTFAVPVACILCVNLVLFVLTTRNIYLSKKLAKIVVEQKRNAKLLDFILYTKLYVIMGLTWLVGFLAATVDKRPLWYVFIVFNTLQGAFLFFAFVFTKKTTRAFRDRRTSWATNTTRLQSRSTASRSGSDSKGRQSF